MKALIKYLRTREAAINLQLAKPPHKYSSGTFHKIRVEIKKLYALFELLNYCKKYFKRKKFFKPFKLVFQQAGKTRELQLEEALLKKQTAKNSLNVYKDGLKRKRLNEQQKYFLIQDKTFLARLKSKFHKVEPFLNIKNKKVNYYLEQKKNKIKKMLNQGSIHQKQIHELRKELKAFNYNLKSLTKRKQNESKLKSNAMPQLLGKWHDSFVMIRHLERAIAANRRNPKELIILKKIKEKIASENNLLFEKINKSVAGQLKILTKLSFENN